MSSSSPISRAELQAIPVKRRLDAIQRYITQHVSQQVHLAAFTDTSYFVPLPKVDQVHKQNPQYYQVTGADLLEGLKAKYPDCTIMFYEKPVPTSRPGVTEQHMGILIDWS
jgi:nicotinic acid mononucleotide adenylyltransferase